MSISSLEDAQSNGSVSDFEQETQSPVSSCSGDHGPPSDRPERMREWIIRGCTKQWLCPTRARNPILSELVQWRSWPPKMIDGSRMINSGRFPGLEWINPEKDTFRVPWVHAKKRGYCRDRDAAIFREWAIHSGKYREDGDPTTWKINFRCAINGLKDIMEIKDMQQEDCRVYKVLPSRGRMRRRRQPQRYEPYSTSVPSCRGMPDDIAPHYTYGGIPTSLYETGYPCNIKMESLSLDSMPCSSYQSVHSTAPTSSVIAHANLPMPHSYVWKQETPFLDQKPFIREQRMAPFLPPLPSTISSKSDIPFYRHDSPDSGIGTGKEPQPSPLMIQNSPQQHSPIPQNSPAMSQQHSPIPQNSPGLLQQHSPIPQNSPILAQQQSPLQMESTIHSPLQMEAPCSVSGSDHTVFQDSESVFEFFDKLESSPSPASSTVNEAHIRIFYGTICVLNKTIDCSNGCRIVADGVSNRFHGDDLNVHTLHLPKTHVHTSAQQIFDTMEQGIHVKSENGNIYVTPLCRTMVYCGSSSTSTPCTLEKDTCSKVFDYSSHFRPALEHFAITSGGPPRPYSILSLGQTWGSGRHVTENLVSIVITHAKAKDEIEQIGFMHLLTDDLLIEIPDSVDVETATEADLEADAFFSKYQDV